MPVLLEGASLVAPADAMARALRALGRDAAGGDGEAGQALALERLGAQAVTSDGVLTALAFEGGSSVWAAARAIEATGLRLLVGCEPGALAAVGQRHGPADWWPWLELAVVPGPSPAPGAEAGPVLAARQAGSQDRAVATPTGWRFEGSASQRHGVGALRLVDRPLRHARREADRDLYLDRWTGEAVRLERTSAPVRAVLEGPAGPLGEVTAEVATRDEEIELGLMFRETLPPGAGMLFRFDWPAHHHFWMKNTLIPLDLLFVGDAGRVVNVAAQAPPLTRRYQHSDGAVRQVLEVPGGWCAAHGVAAGARLRVVGGG